MKQSESASSKVSRTLQTNVPSRESRAIGWADVQVRKSCAIGDISQFMASRKGGKGGFGKKKPPLPPQSPSSGSPEHTESETQKPIGCNIIRALEVCQKSINGMEKEIEQRQKEKGAIERIQESIKREIEEFRTERDHLIIQREEIPIRIKELEQQCNEKSKGANAFYYHQLTEEAKALIDQDPSQAVVLYEVVLRMRKKTMKLHSGGDGGHMTAADYVLDDLKTANAKMEDRKKKGGLLKFKTNTEIENETQRIYSEICYKINKDEYDEINNLKEEVDRIEQELQEYESHMKEQEMRLQDPATQKRIDQLVQEIDTLNDSLSKEKEKYDKLTKEWDDFEKQYDDPKKD